MGGITPICRIVAGDTLAMHISTAYMATQVEALPTTTAIRRLVVGYVDDWQLSIIGVRRGLATIAAREGTIMLKAIGVIGLLVNRAKLAVVCDSRQVAIEVARAVGAPVKKKGMFKGRTLGTDLASLRQRRWRATDTVLTSRLERAARRLVRAAHLRKAAARGATRLYATGIKPSVEYGIAIHGA